MTNEMWVAIIGAIAAIVGALFSTVSICLTNKNTKKIKWLENSQSVKAKIASERDALYHELIRYINSWYEVENNYKFNYVECPARQYLQTTIFKCRFNSIKDIENELQKISELCLNYFYLDSGTYKTLKALENYLQNVVLCLTVNKIDNFNLFAYLVYCDLWKYIFKLSKGVNKFIKDEDALRFKHSKSIKKKDLIGLYHKTNLYNIYDDGKPHKNKSYLMWKTCLNCTRNCILAKKDQ